MQLNTLLNSSSYPEIEITGLTLDSRHVKPGDLFFAFQGMAFDGRKFIPEALQKGAAAILTDDTKKYSSPIFSIENLSQKIGEIASRFFHEPSREMKVIGVTGTNGKTSCTHFLASSLSKLNHPCGIIGTLGNGLYGKLAETNLTTPDGITLQKLLADFLKQNAKHVAMEVSSHSLDQGRVNGIEFSIGIFTNLTRDHLDYHGSMENYGSAKRKLFEFSSLKSAVINADDAFGKKLIENFSDKKNIYAYSLKKSAALKNVSLIYADEIQSRNAGTYFKIFSPWGSGECFLPLIGNFNISNALAVFTTLCLLEIPFEKNLELISQLNSVPGRMQTWGGDSHPLVVVDYAHTPDALEKVLIALKEHTEGKVYCVFGCGGDRDKGKRPMMASIAEKYADFIIVTDDNPRHENPEAIVKDLQQGFSRIKPLVEHNREKAIQTAIKNASKKDCILIAGKGAEAYQIVGDEKRAFSDASFVEIYLSKMRY